MSEVSFPAPLRAAQYLRMSTDQQKYSTANQADAIAAYAARNNMTIVRTYLDEARSGLTFAGRHALEGLIDDVLLGRADFDRVLVYDVSRWGRFQDIDESAYYEFVCKKAGVRIHYCEEAFDNDGSFVSAILKNIKRIGAGDYSRDLSVRVFAGSCRLTRLGFKQGGTAGYALQRVLVDQFGKPKCVLQPGDRKALKTDRIILRPGRPEEIETVRGVFHAFVRQRKTEAEIARDLNRRGVTNEFGRPWRMLAIRRLLTCEKYVGGYVYNRVSSKLKGKKIPNPPDKWVRCDNAFEAIVQPAMFKAAARRIAKRPRCTSRASISSAEMLQRLKTVLAEKGKLSAGLIDRAARVPCHMTYIERFGSLREAYELIGYRPDSFRRSQAKRAVTAGIADLAGRLVSRLTQAGCPVVGFDAKSGVLTVAGNRFLIAIARCQHQIDGNLRWWVRRALDAGQRMTIVARMDEPNATVLDYFLIPPRVVRSQTVRFSAKRTNGLMRYRVGSFDELGDAVLALEPSARSAKRHAPGSR